MSQLNGPLTFLDLNGVQVGNGARTVGYLRRGLAGGRWELGPASPCSVLYRLNGGTCLHPETFVSPTADPAPWYDSTEPGSATFLGLVLLDIEGYDSTIQRAVSPRLVGLQGGSLGAQRRVPREWKFRGVMVSGDGAGAEYGLRWLTGVLQSSVCDGCASGTLKVRLSCPPTDCSNDAAGEWTSYDVALTDGPHETQKYAEPDPGFLGGCRDWVVVEFTLTAANPYLYKRPVTRDTITFTANAGACTDICAFLFSGAGSPHCVPVTVPARGTVGSIFTFVTTTGFSGMLLEAYAVCPGSGGSSSPDPVLRMELAGIPAASTVVVNAATHVITVTYLDPDTGLPVTIDGQYLIVISDTQPLQWIEAAYCDSITCLCVRTAEDGCADGTVIVTVQTQAREG